ncbi:hypothetical protein [Actinomadura rupiterrae]|uniref:hypothetical protein n=1 Tax=Actinomadura rupiterrae TaxID=559627 RepID=UPI0020A49C92|nr:hypothetical protein [Actinomadura rupiterrae]MCP2342055.1 hypothetical protein [Actinomadura rupiterrae]
MAETTTGKRVGQVNWQEHGLVRVAEGFLPADRFDALVAEGELAAQRGEPYERAETSGHRDGSFAAPAHCQMASGGPVLEGLLYDKALLLVLRELIGMARLVPFGCAYVTYQHGDFQGLHTDDVKATLTLGVALTDNLGPMGWAPDLRAVHPDVLADVVAQYGMFPEGDQFGVLEHPHGPGVLQGWAGYDIPHWRPPHTDQRPARLVTLSYLDL